MATSGSKNFTYTRNDIIFAALRKIGEFDSGETPDGDITSDAAQALNLLINELTGIYDANIFLRTELTLFLQKGQQKYSVGPSGDNVTAAYVETKLNGGEPTSETAMVVDSITGVSNGDYIGVEVDDGSIHWTTVNGSPSSSTITLTTGLDDAAADNSRVYAYTTKAYRPIAINPEAVIRRDANDYDTSIQLIGEGEYYSLSQKGNSGPLTQAYYKSSLTDGTLYVWPTGDGQTDKIVFVAHYYPDDFDSAANNAEFPVEWGKALIYGLASDLAPEFQLPERQQVRLYQHSQILRENALMLMLRMPMCNSAGHINETPSRGRCV